MRKALIGLGILLVSACSGPMGPIAGDELEGTPTQWPDDWSSTDAVENVLLQTDPGDPYSVTLWMVQVANIPYVAAASSESRWALNLQENPHAILSVEGRLYNVSARMVSDTKQIDRVIQAYLTKYEIETEEDFVQEEGVLFRLQRR